MEIRRFWAVFDQNLLFPGNIRGFCVDIWHNIKFRTRQSVAPFVGRKFYRPPILTTLAPPD